MMAPEGATLITKVILISPELGGRRNPLPRSGYRGQFFYNDSDCDSSHIFDVEYAVPCGQEVTDYVFLLNPVHHSRMWVGMRFLIREGPNTIGYGRVVEVSTPPNASDGAAAIDLSVVRGASLSDKAHAARTCDDFIAFVLSLTEEFERNGHEWENDNLGRYLEAIGGWTSDMDGYFLNRGEPVPEEPTWSLFASILLAACIYE